MTNQKMWMERLLGSPNHKTNKNQWGNRKKRKILSTPLGQTGPSKKRESDTDWGMRRNSPRIHRESEKTTKKEECRPFFNAVRGGEHRFEDGIELATSSLIPGETKGNAAL